MPHHVPIHSTWRAHDLADALRRLGIECEVNGDQVRAVMPVVEFMDVEKIVAAKTIDELTPKKLGEATAILAFSVESIIDNISIDYDLDLLSSCDHHLDYTCLEKALEDCGYISGSELEIVQLYLADDLDALHMVEEIDNLQLQKEELVSNQKFVAAKAILQKQRLLRNSLEEKLKKSAG